MLFGDVVTQLLLNKRLQKREKHEKDGRLPDLNMIRAY
jgi:hypothetical protein